MNTRKMQRINNALGQFRLSSVTVEKELSDWDTDAAERDLLIFFITRLAGYKSALLSLEETIGELFAVDLSKITEGLSQQKDLMKLLMKDEPS